MRALLPWIAGTATALLGVVAVRLISPRAPAAHRPAWAIGGYLLVILGITALAWVAGRKGRTRRPPPP